MERAAAEHRAIDVVPDDEKRSSIHTVDGYAYLSENMTMGDLRAQAFANAKRQAGVDGNLEEVFPRLTEKKKGL